MEQKENLNGEGDRPSYQSDMAFDAVDDNNQAMEIPQKKKARKISFRASVNSQPSSTTPSPNKPDEAPAVKNLPE